KRRLREPETAVAMAGGAERHQARRMGGMDAHRVLKDLYSLIIPAGFHQPETCRQKGASVNVAVGAV
ncbi:MAG: hypothetical protein KAH44_23475, partial [Oricola sp.]|nr:hypothetical protein [Oricola sp.]